MVRQIAQPQATPSPIATVPPLQAVTALGRLEPQGEVIKLASPTSLQSARVERLRVKEGDPVQAGDIIAELDNRDRLQADFEKARQQVDIAQANLAKVEAGAQAGEIAAQQAVIARLENELQGQIATQQATLARLLVDLQGEQSSQTAKIARLEAAKNNAQVEANRYQALYEQGAVGESTYDTKRLAAETAEREWQEAIATRSQSIGSRQQQLNEAKATRDRIVSTLNQQIREARATLNRIAEVRPVDIRQAQAQVKDAIATVRQAKSQLDTAIVRSPVAGQVLKIHARPGETVGNDGIVEIGQTGQMIAIAEVYESDISKVKVGQNVAITSETNAFPGELTGKVSQVGLQIGKRDILNTDPAADVDARVVEVRVTLDPAASRKVAGLTYSKVVVKIKI